jgi:hypothetical protein
VTAARLPLPLCRFDGHTCAACCWGEAVRPATLRSALRRQTRLFRRRFPRGRLPGLGPLLHYEVAARRGLDLLLGCLLLLPPLAAWLRPRTQRRLVCAFLAFEDDREERVGCLLHPSRWNGVDLRPRAAFRLLRGVSCGAPDWYCLAAHWFARATWQERRDFGRWTEAQGWYGFSRAATRYVPAADCRPGNKPPPPRLPL